jgi:hypothetical protein
MGFTVKERPSSNAFLVPAGTHLATAFALIGVGFQETSFGIKNRVYVGWEIHGHRFKWTKDGHENDAPATVWRAYNVSLFKQATLRIDIEAWRGKSLTKEEAKNFDLFGMVGKSCQLTVEHAHVGEKTYGNVMSVNQLLEGTEAPPLESDEIRYLQPDDVADWNLVPDFLRKKIENQADDPNPVAPANPFREDSVDDIGW